ncbi:ribonuclease iii [Moniliophthora roreri MCA 2997]|uniref:Ribonuclease iii n=1 Tax=Moniliophthora roreri (strain MCA 2997) TaxID=1381753 RepID=V2Z238_MONRO|nr:ribonuclease iii [Moniliophthora roreri MCA 2997]
MSTYLGSTYNSSSSTSIHLKRARSEAPHSSYTTTRVGTAAAGSATQQTSGASGGLPPLPKISGEYLLQVYTHKSLRRSDDVSPEEFEDSERLSVLGEKVFNAAVTNVLFRRRLMKTRDEIMQLAEQIMSDSHIDTWVTAYKLRDKVRCTPDAYDKLATPGETRDLFHAFIGGLFAGSGLDAVNNLIDLLLGGEDSSNQIGVPEPSGPPPTYRPSTPPHKRIKSEPPSDPPLAGPSQPPQPPIFFASQPSPSSAARPASNLMTAFNSAYPNAGISTGAQPYMPSQQYYSHQQPNFLKPQAPQRKATIPNPLAPAQPYLAFLPLFNQTATQRKVKVDYQAAFTGPSHAGKWTVQCVVNGIPKGMGSGVTKQVAKEEAARQAYYAMGWT